jgi:hypothetical protein
MTPNHYASCKLSFVLSIFVNFFPLASVLLPSLPPLTGSHDNLLVTFVYNQPCSWIYTLQPWR